MREVSEEQFVTNLHMRSPSAAASTLNGTSDHSDGTLYSAASEDLNIGQPSVVV